MNGTRRVPYRLPELIEGKKNKAEIWLCEGEKDADNLRSLGFTVSSFKNWKAEFNEFVKDSIVVLLVDHDRAGIKQANDAANLLFGNVASLKVIDLFSNEPLPEKHGADVSDFINLCVKDESLTADEIAERLGILAENADAWQPTGEEIEDGAAINEVDETPIEIKPFPEPLEKCFHGLAGDFVRLIEPHTEADKMALLIQFLAYFGNIIGRSAFYQSRRQFAFYESVLRVGRRYGIGTQRHIVRARSASLSRFRRTSPEGMYRRRSGKRRRFAVSRPRCLLCYQKE